MGVRQSRAVAPRRSCRTSRTRVSLGGRTSAGAHLSRRHGCRPNPISRRTTSMNPVVRAIGARIAVLACAVAGAALVPSSAQAASYAVYACTAPDGSRVSMGPWMKFWAVRANHDDHGADPAPQTVSPLQAQANYEWIAPANATAGWRFSRPAGTQLTMLEWTGQTTYKTE